MIVRAAPRPPGPARARPAAYSLREWLTRWVQAGLPRL